jgi:hypothetical protein
LQIKRRPKEDELTITEVTLPARQTASNDKLTDEQLKVAVRLLKAGKTVGPDDRYKSRNSAQTAVFNFRREVARRSDLKADTLRGTSYQRPGETEWSIAVFPKTPKATAARKAAK